MEFNVEFAGGARDFYFDLKNRFRSDSESLSNDEIQLLRKLYKVKKLLEEQGPSYPGLNTHTIDELTKKYEYTVWESYVDQGEKAFRVFWGYGPGRGEITITGIEPHPESSNRKAYSRISLAEIPKD